MQLSATPPIADLESAFVQSGRHSACARHHSASASPPAALARYPPHHALSFLTSLQLCGTAIAHSNRFNPVPLANARNVNCGPSPFPLAVRGSTASAETLQRVSPVTGNAYDSSSMPSVTLQRASSDREIGPPQPHMAKQRTSTGPITFAAPDPFKELHSFLEKEGEIRGVLGREAFTKEEISSLVEKLKDTRRKGMQLVVARKKANGQPTGDLVQSFSCVLDPESLLPGEYVVHKTKGIGRFLQLKYDVEKKSEYVILQYADGLAKLKAQLASRLLYRFFQPGEKGKAPALNKLNDPRLWENRKNKGRLAAQKMIMDLLQLYMSRLKQRRPPYPKHEEEMRRFAAKFLFRPTPDQEQAFLDVERDMVDRGTPMDRLICGDVGFGKTEVALRAIFRVFVSGKQAMVLAPTTVLAQQHYNVICERFSDYKARVAILSRFQSVAEKKVLLARIKDGSLDIIVGTHALLSSNIHYSNLGLLVVDEEQRFGVKQKELITSFKTSVDVLTLSATPIPRTLALALTGFRDASLIQTPPPERIPIKTHMLEYNEEKIKAAVEFELARNGQVYYVLPRKKDIELKKQSLEDLFPGIKIGVAHGKKSAVLLEETMDAFAQGESEMLLCTNIIESGLDIRRVNTIVVEDVHLFGLAQLYQLRGRVGRADKESHAYLFYPGKDNLSDEALERLVAIQECCNLGQGFNLAERDLAIRGFGSIFGEKQSGEVAHIGMDLFFDMVFEILSNADNHVFFQYDYSEVKLDLDVNHLLTSDYIQDPRKHEAVVFQLEESARTGIRELMFFINSLRCDFGRETYAFEVLLKTTYIKRMAADLGIHHILVRGKTITMKTGISETFFEILKDGMTSDTWRSSITFQDGVIEVLLLIELATDRLIDMIFACLVSLRKGLSSFGKQKNH